MLKRLLHELDYSLSRTDTDVFPLAIQVLHQRLSGLGNIGLEAVQCAFNDYEPRYRKYVALFCFTCRLLDSNISGCISPVAHSSGS